VKVVQMMFTALVFYSTVFLGVFMFFGGFEFFQSAFAENTFISRLWIVWVFTVHCALLARLGKELNDD
jgi:hypothetical protein